MTGGVAVIVIFLGWTPLLALWPWLTEKGTQTQDCTIRTATRKGEGRKERIIYHFRGIIRQRGWGREWIIHPEQKKTMSCTLGPLDYGGNKPYGICQLAQRKQRSPHLCFSSNYSQTVMGIHRAERISEVNWTFDILSTPSPLCHSLSLP